MSTKSIQSINAFFLNFIQEQVKNNSDIVALWNSQENQDKFKIAVKQAMPKAKREKKLKDPAAPKKPSSAYILFGEEYRKENKEKGLKGKDMIVAISEAWRTLKDSSNKKDKARLKALEERAKKDKARFDEQMNSYEPPSDEELAKLKVNIKRERKTSKTSEKKKRKSAYNVFMAEKTKGTKGKANMSEIASEWKSFTEAEKKPYQDKADEQNAENGFEEIATKSKRKSKNINLDIPQIKEFLSFWEENEREYNEGLVPWFYAFKTGKSKDEFHACSSSTQKKYASEMNAVLRATGFDVPVKRGRKSSKASESSEQGEKKTNRKSSKKVVEPDSDDDEADDTPIVKRKQGEKKSRSLFDE